MSLPVIHLLTNDNPEEFSYRHIKIDGILNNVELYVFAGQHGYHVLSPILLTNGNYMLVNKGIISEKKERALEVKKTVIEGVLYCDQKKNWFIKNDVSSNTWFTFNTKEISNELGIKLEKCILWQDGFNNKLAIQPMKHLEYAVTWFFLALVWLIMYIKVIISF